MSPLTWFAIAGLLLGGGARSWDFEEDPLGSKPTGFLLTTTAEAAPGRWEIAEDDGAHVLAQLDEKSARRRYAMAIAEEPEVGDLKLSVRIKAVRGKREQSGGLVWRYQCPNNYLVARLDVTEKNVRLFRFWEGNRVQIGIKENLELETGKWYVLRVEQRGAEIKVYLGDDILFIEQDRHFPEPGKVGLWTKSHSVMHFDKLKLDDLSAAK